MRNLLILLALFFAVPAFAADYGKCANSIANSPYKLISPPLPIEYIAIVADQIAIIVVMDELGGSVVPVSKLRQPILYRVLSSGPERAWIGVVEGIDGASPALWMQVWVVTSGCVMSGVGERVYWERANAPAAFGPAVRSWEQDHPNIDRLVHSP